MDDVYLRGGDGLLAALQLSLFLGEVRGEELKGIKALNITLAVLAPDASLLSVINDLEMLARGEWSPAEASRHADITDVDNLHATDERSLFNRRVFFIRHIKKHFLQTLPLPA